MAFPSDARRKHDPQFLAPYRPDDFPEQRHLADQPVHVVDRPTLIDVHAPRGGNHGFLFRIDPLPGGGVAIVVQSAREPDWDYAFHNAGYFLAAPPQVKEFDADAFEVGQKLRFRLVANPTRKIDTKTREDGKRNNGKRVPVRNEQLYAWLAQRAERAGLLIDEKSTSIKPAYVYLKKPIHRTAQRLRSVQYDGLLRVTDAARFRETLVRGIGPGKAFGFGLLSVAACQPAGALAPP